MARYKDSTELKVTRGTYRSDRDKPTQKVVATTKIMPLPDYANEHAKREHKKVLAWLKENGMLETVNQVFIVAYCVEMGQYFECMADIAKDGRTYSNSYGTELANPLVAQSTNCLKNALQLAREFGLTPVSKNRVNLNKDSEEDELEILKKRKKVA